MKVSNITYISKIRLNDVIFGEHQSEIELSDVDKRKRLV